MTWLKSWRARIVLMLAVIGPGFITANVDNDAGGIFTYSQAGAQFGYSLLWTMIPITVALVVVVSNPCVEMFDDDNVLTPPDAYVVALPELDTSDSNDAVVVL